MSKGISQTLLAAWVWVLAAGWAGVLWGQAAQGAPGGLPPSAAGEKQPDGSGVLAGVLQWATQEVEWLDKNVVDYSSTLISRERMEGKLGEYETAFVKIRHRPFSVYACIASPDSRKGNEAIYAEGKNNNRLLVHTTGVFGKLFGTLTLDPTSSAAMKDRRHPITELGMREMCRGLIRLLESDRYRAECQVRVLRGAKVNQRVCTCMEVLHPVQRENSTFHRVRLFVDEELKLPIRYERYDWLGQPGSNPELVEEYTYLEIKLNIGLNDAVFDPRNPSYAFP